MLHLIFFDNKLLIVYIGFAGGVKTKKIICEIYGIKDILEEFRYEEKYVKSASEEVRNIIKENTE